MSNTLRKFGIIGSSIWQSEKFNTLTCRDAQLAYLWLHTSYKTCAGVLRVGPAHLAEEIAWIENVEHAQRIFRAWQEVGLISWIKPYVVLLNFLAFNPVKSYKHAIGAFNEAFGLPDCPDKNQLLQALRRQKGSMDLVRWRDKKGEPHEIVFAIHEYFNESALGDGQDVSELNPLDTPSKGYPNPSGIMRMKMIKEKGESISAAQNQNAPQVVSEDLLGTGEMQSKGGTQDGPRSSTLASQLARQ